MFRVVFREVFRVVFRGAVVDEGGRTGRSIHGSGRDHRAAAVARESKRLLRYDDGDDAVWSAFLELDRAEAEADEPRTEN